MNICDIVLNLALGVIGGIISSALLYWFSLYYKAGYKEDFYFALHSALISASQIEVACHFTDDYAVVMGQIDTLCEAAFKMYRCLLPLTLWYKRKEKKLIITLMNDIINTCEQAKCITVGYDGNKEREARLKKISKCFYRNESLNRVC